jgi:putative spermidine/putrescine transport system permease protein
VDLPPERLGGTVDAAEPGADNRGRKGRRRAHRWTSTPSLRLGLGLSLPLIVLLVGWVLIPLVRLITTALGAPKGWGNLTDFFSDSSNLVVLRTTFVDALIVTLLCVAIGSVVAWSMRTTSRTTVRLMLSAATFVPFLMGSVIKVYAFTVLLERMGVVNRILLQLHIIHEPLDLLYNQFAVIVGMAYQMFPYAVLPLYVAFMTIDLDLIRVAESLGASRWRALRSVVAPLAAPSVFATGVIVYVISLGFYLTPVILGGATAQFAANGISQDIFQYYNLSGAAVSGLVLMAGALLAVAIGYKAVGRERLERALG